MDWCLLSLSNGCSVMALKAQALLARRGSDLAVVRTDINNAFNDVQHGQLHFRDPEHQ